MLRLNTKMSFNHFNSIKVRLERILNLLLTSFGVFQFHKGAIRTLKGIHTNAVKFISIP